MWTGRILSSAARCWSIVVFWRLKPRTLSSPSALETCNTAKTTIYGDAAWRFLQGTWTGSASGPVLSRKPWSSTTPRAATGLLCVRRSELFPCLFGPPISSLQPSPRQQAAHPVLAGDFQTCETLFGDCRPDKPSKLSGSDSLGSLFQEHRAREVLAMRAGEKVREAAEV